MFLTVLLGLFQEAHTFRYQVLKQLTIVDPIHDIHQVEFKVLMEFGSLKQPMELNIDTGFLDLWIPSIDAKGFLNYEYLNYNKKIQHQSRDSIVSHHPLVLMLIRQPYLDFYCLYFINNNCLNIIFIKNSLKSLDCNTNFPYKIYYNDDPITGTQVLDQVWMYNIKFHQSFLLIERASGNMASSGGILGLGFYSNAANQNPFILESLYEQKLISKKYFSLYLKDESEFGSYILFGGIDIKFAQKDQQMSYVPLQISSNSKYDVQEEIKGKFRSPYNQEASKIIPMCMF